MSQNIFAGHEHKDLQSGNEFLCKGGYDTLVRR